MQNTLWLAEESTASGTLNIGSGGAAPGTFDVNIISGGGGDATVNFNHTDAGYLFNSEITGLVTVNHIGPGRTILTNRLSHSGGTAISDGTLQVGNGGTIGSLLGNVTNDAGLVFNRSDTVVIESDITGSGTTTVETGKLQIGSGNTFGSIQQDIVNNAEVAFARSDDLTYAGDMSGTGDLIKQLSNTLTLTGFSNYSGTTSVEAGTLVVDGEIFGSGGVVTVNTGATLTGTGRVVRDVEIASGATLGNTLTVVGSISLLNGTVTNVTEVESGDTFTAGVNEQVFIDAASGGTIDTGNGIANITNFSGDAELTTGSLGGTIGTMSGGTVNTSNGGTVKILDLDSGTINLAAGSNLAVEGGDFDGSIEGSGGLTKVGDGLLSLNQANSFTGDAYIYEGTVQIGAIGAMGVAPKRVYIDNRGKFQVLANVSNDIFVELESEEAEYVKTFSGERLRDLGPVGTDRTPVTLDSGDDFTGEVTVTAKRETSQNFLSDRINLEGLDGTTFVMILLADALPANIDPQDFFLGWEKTEGEWVNAVDGNNGQAGGLAGYHNMTYDAFEAANGGWNAITMLGAYGSDAATGEAWAVIDHNSPFSVQLVPEPSALTIFGMGALLFLSRRRPHRAG